MKHALSAHFVLLIHSVIGWFLGAVAKSVCVGFRWLRPAAFDYGKKLAANVSGV